jgi:hypothetical protein
VVHVRKVPQVRRVWVYDGYQVTNTRVEDGFACEHRAATVLTEPNTGPTHTGLSPLRPVMMYHRWRWLYSSTARCTVIGRLRIAERDPHSPLLSPLWSTIAGALPLSVTNRTAFSASASVRTFGGGVAVLLPFIVA